MPQVFINTFNIVKCPFLFLGRRGIIHAPPVRWCAPSPLWLPTPGEAAFSVASHDPRRGFGWLPSSSRQVGGSPFCPSGLSMLVSHGGVLCKTDERRFFPIYLLLGEVYGKIPGGNGVSASLLDNRYIYISPIASFRDINIVYLDSPSFLSSTGFNHGGQDAFFQSCHFIAPFRLSPVVSFIVAL